jgi:tRNA(fMet)-specific endonuclease VapC
MNYVLETTIVSELIDKNETPRINLSVMMLSGNKFFISAITYYEVKRGLIYQDKKNEMGLFEELCKMFPILLLDRIDIFDIASRIWAALKKHGRPLGDEKNTRNGDADILIAATSIFMDCIVRSRDEHFVYIKEISELKTEMF